ncbi:MAG: adenylate/guanylate cyclase domain-containing protein [Pseudomonadota bacterium]|nr:adenylate/guanylate cyclase domain-containing protein [Pseudomonadota bacterium]
MMSEQLPEPLTVDTQNQYVFWRNDFMFQRLRLVLIIGIISFLTFIGLNLSRYPEVKPAWLWTNLSQEMVLIPCLFLLHTYFGRRHLGIIFLLLSWSITIIPQYWSLQGGIAKFDFVTWTLVFLIQATFIPVRWRLHLLSQLGLFACFFAIQLWAQAELESQIAHADPFFLYLYLFWFCVICNISVYLYEKLQRAEFEAKQELEAEQQKSERLLLNILPKSIAERLKQKHAIVAEDFAQVTVLFADIVGFTQLSSHMSPPELVELLNKVFSKFDKLVDQHGLEKIKTIGDAYMVVAGLPTPCSNHVAQIADLAIDMQDIINGFKTHTLKIRIGIHSGPVVAGVIGIKKFAYDLWGDTVNIASRMESQGIKGRIQISDSVYEILKHQDKYKFEKRTPVIEVKGKGAMQTYFLKRA